MIAAGPGRRRQLPRLLAGLTLLAAGCSGGATPAGLRGTGPLIVVSAPLTTSPWIGRFTEDGARLAVEHANAAPGRRSPLRLQVLDNGGSPQTAAANAREAVAEGAAAIITDGTGAIAVAQVTDPVSLPVFVVFDGGASFVNPTLHPTLFRLAPANRYMTRRLADYAAARSSVSAVLGDDSEYGQDGARQVTAALQHDAVTVTSDILVPSGAGDVSPQVLAARRSGAKALFVWAGSRITGAVIRTARANGWQVPIFTSPTAEDPLVRQGLADHPDWLDGTTFVSFRITSEQGPGPFNTFRSAFERRFGPDPIGVTADGRPVIQPPDWATFSFDSVGLVATALDRDGGKPGASLLSALESVVTTSANGDERGYGPGDREGVSPSDIYFARFHHLRFAPVTDDLLSTHLPAVAQ